MAKTKKRKFKYTDYVTTSIKAAKMSIEMFNRVDFYHKDESALIFAGQAWELLAKGLVIKEQGFDKILLKGGKTITAEKALSLANHVLHKINQDEAEIVLQIISLRNVAMHDVMPKIPSEIITHLLYYSLKSFRRVLQENFKNHFKSDFNQNFLSISFSTHTSYSDKVSRLFGKSKEYNSDHNKLLYLLDRGIDFARKSSATNMESFSAWQDKIKKLPRRSRVAMHLSIYKHINETSDVVFVPVETPRGYKAEVEISKTKNKKEAGTVLIKKTDPNKDYPHSTSDLASIVGRGQNFIAKMAIVLGMKDNEDFCYLFKTSKSSIIPKYSDAALTHIQNYLRDNPTFNPYRP